MSDQVQVTLSRTTAQKLLAKCPEERVHAMRPGQRELLDALRAALTQQEGQEVEEQYRLVRSDGLKTAVPLATAAEAREFRADLEVEKPQPWRIQHRTVTYTPWTDLPDHSEDEEGRG